MQCLEALPGDGEDVLAIGALVAQGLEVVLHACECIGQRVQHLAAGNTLLVNQFALGEEADALEVIRGSLQFEHAQRAADFIEQAWYFGELSMVPTGFHERNERLARIAEIGYGFAGEHLQQLLRIRRAQGILGRRGRACVLPHPGDLVFERRIDEQQRTGDIQQRLLGRRHAARHDAGEIVALAADHVARATQAEHAEGVANAFQCLDFRLQPGRIRLAGAQVQVERILDAEYVFLQRACDGIEQRPVESGHAALRVQAFGLGNLRFAQPEGLAEAVQCRMRGSTVGHLLQQLAHRVVQRRRCACAQAISMQRIAGFLFDGGVGIAQRTRGTQCTCVQCIRGFGTHPQHAADIIVLGERKQPVEGGFEGARIGRTLALPAIQRAAQLGHQRLCRGHARGSDQRIRTRHFVG